LLNKLFLIVELLTSVILFSFCVIKASFYYSVMCSLFSDKLFKTLTYLIKSVNIFYLILKAKQFKHN